MNDFHSRLFTYFLQCQQARKNKHDRVQQEARAQVARRKAEKVLQMQGSEAAERASVSASPRTPLCHLKQL